MSSTEAPFIRQPAVSGRFYPEDPVELKYLINSYLDRAEQLDLGHIYGLVAPHAGYVYSGAVSGVAYKQIKGRQYKRVVVISPSHFQAVHFASVMPNGYYLTPLGLIPIDALVVEIIAQGSCDGCVQKSNVGHSVSHRLGEHALEVQLPFLQVVLGDFSLVPIVMGDQSWHSCRMLAELLVPMVKAKDTLVVASSDLSHYHPYDKAKEIDNTLLTLVRRSDAEGVADGCASRVVEACGGGPIATVMEIGKLVGASAPTVLAYATSGDVEHGSKDQVVGYSAIAIHE